MASVSLKPQREKSLLRKHPWVFSGAIRDVSEAAAPGETVDILSSDGTWLARGAFSPHSQIIVRVWTFDPAETVSPVFFSKRIQTAVSLRHTIPSLSGCDAYRLINAESDGLPGIVVDRYGPVLVCQFLTVGAEFWKEIIIKELARQIPVRGIYERSDVNARLKDNLKKRTGLLYGDIPSEPLKIREGSAAFLVDIRQGQKTGFYLDQRENRTALADYTLGKDVLNGFSYTGGFGIWAMVGGASSVLNIDSSESAIDLARRNAELNGFSENQVKNTKADVFSALRQIRESGRRFDVVVLDPPKFADSRAHLDRACRGYKDINRLGLGLLREGGLLMTFSCSAHVLPELFQKVVADAALDAGRPGVILHRFGQSADHPVSLSFPEGTYLKGLLIKV